ncbi:hypothetical protein [Iodobacter sp. BJB302]|uniref:hypothetical protein n=1 Tax=Iodobacter sp. BJB302 TaxID=1506510 RepID=UPI000C0E5303|nr:hypothetical protein [Iodobacter sp. BJB302]PHV02817.1 hypothetical protein CSQ88_05240 [Iodobacter sp. BJB302]
MGIAMHAVDLQRPGLAKAMKVAENVTMSLRAIDWLIRKGLSVALQGSKDELTGKPFVLIEYAHGYCSKFKADFAAERVRCVCNHTGTFEVWQFEMNGCLIQWLEVKS